MSERPEALIVIGMRQQDNEIALVRRCRCQILYFNTHISLEDALQVDVPIEMALNDEASAVVQALKLAERFTIRGVYCLNEYRVPLASRMAETLGLPHTLSYEAALNCRNKKRTRQVLMRHGVSTAHFRLVHTPDEAETAIAERSLPVVVKPSNDSGSNLVQRCATVADVREAVERIQHKVVNAVGQPVDPEILVEEYLTGEEYSVEACTVRGTTTVLAITTKQLTPWPLTVEIGHCVPAPLSDEDERAIHRVVSQALAALGVDYAVTHTELKLTSTGPRIVEVNARPAGDPIPILVRAVTGYDLHEVALHVALGGTMEDVPRHEPVAPSAASRHPIAEWDGVLQMADPNVIALLPEVYVMQMTMHAGDYVERTVNNYNQLGQFVVYGTPERHANQVADEVLARLAISVTRPEAVVPHSLEGTHAFTDACDGEVPMLYQ